MALKNIYKFNVLFKYPVFVKYITRYTKKQQNIIQTWGKKLIETESECPDVRVSKQEPERSILNMFEN